MTETTVTSDPTLLAMQALRDQGWCIVLKALPKQLGWRMDACQSEYDAPCPAKIVAKGKWCCQAEWFGDGPYRGRLFAFADSPAEAVQKVTGQNKFTMAQFGEDE